MSGCVTRGMDQLVLQNFCFFCLECLCVLCANVCFCVSVYMSLCEWVCANVCSCMGLCVCVNVCLCV